VVRAELDDCGHGTWAEWHARGYGGWLGCLVGTWHPYRDVGVSPDGLAEPRAGRVRAERE